MRTSKTASDIRELLDALDLDVVASYFDTDDDDIDPYVVCEGVSVAAFNRYVGDGEGLRVGVRFLALDGGRLMILELPTRVHESTVVKFTSEFLAATGNRREIGTGGSMTAARAGNPNKEADTTFGPKRTTLNRTPPPAGRTIAAWVTLAVEVGRSQSWASLENAAQWWCNYHGIQYILLLKISRTGNEMRYALYDLQILGALPAPVTSGTLQRSNPAPPDPVVSFDMHRILSIPPQLALPRGVNARADVNLRVIMDLVISDLD